ncbi:MAG: diguanylate cyclase [Spirochaetia bacterium]|nr:diguanylate cyclase [Spirochaetia bacterium]
MHEQDFLSSGNGTVNAYLLLLTAAGLLSASFVARSVINIRYKGFWAFALVHVGMSWWTICYLGEQLAPPESRMLWFQLKFAGIGLIAPSWMIYISYHVGRPLAPWAMALCYWEALVLVPVIFTNPTHRLLYKEVYWSGEMAATNGPLALVHILWNYGLLITAAAMLVRGMIAHKSHRRQLLSLFLAGLFPWVGSIANEFLKADPSLRAYIPLNPTLPGFVLSSLATGWAIFRWRILNPRSIAREHLFDTMADALVILDDRDIVADVNRAAADVIRSGSRRLVGVPAHKVFARWPNLIRRFGDLKSAHAEIWMETNAGPRCYDFHIHPLTGSGGEHIGRLLAGRDITERKELEDKLRFLGNHDSLTGLYNRAFIEEESERIRKGRSFPVSVMVFDVDSLKELNDTQGHHAGDELIRSMASFLLSCFRGDDLVARMGGDEFWVILPKSDRETLNAIEKRIDEEIVRFNEGRAHPLSFSHGSAIIESADAWTDGIRAADLQMYAIKKGRKGAARA